MKVLCEVSFIVSAILKIIGMYSVFFFYLSQSKKDTSQKMQSSDISGPGQVSNAATVKVKEEGSKVQQPWLHSECKASLYIRLYLTKIKRKKIIPKWHIGKVSKSRDWMCNMKIMFHNIFVNSVWWVYSVLLHKCKHR